MPQDPRHIEPKSTTPLNLATPLPNINQTWQILQASMTPSEWATFHAETGL